MSVGLTVVTYNRIAYLAQCLNSIKLQLVDPGVVDRVYVVDDGSDEPARTKYRELAAASPWATFIGAAQNGGVGKAKNIGLRVMLGDGHRWLFLSEDDVIVQSPLAVLGYMGAATRSGLHHLAFHTNRPTNAVPSGIFRGPSDDPEAPVTLWPNSLGAWAVYSAESVRTCGLMDERFLNAWEHVEHTMRLGEVGFTTRGMGNFADATGSERWISEIPGSFESSVIAQRSDHRDTMLAGLQHWKRAHPETYRWVAPIFEQNAAQPHAQVAAVR